MESSLPRLFSVLHLGAVGNLLQPDGAAMVT